MSSRFRPASKTVLGGGFRRRDMAEGEFLGRLWALFGPPQQATVDGFFYDIEDTATGLFFNAYSAASGPAYGVIPRDRPVIGEVLDAFDAIVDATSPVECRVVLGTHEIGWEDGAPFERRIASG